MVNRDRISLRNDDIIKNLFIFFVLKKLIEADFLIFNAKKTIHFLQNTFIQILVFDYFDLKHYIYI